MHQTIETLFKNNFAALSSTSDSRDLPEELSSHSISSNTKKLTHLDKELKQSIFMSLNMEKTNAS